VFRLVLPRPRVGRGEETNSCEMAVMAPAFIKAVSLNACLRVPESATAGSSASRVSHSEVFLALVRRLKSCLIRGKAVVGGCGAWRCCSGASPQNFYAWRRFRYHVLRSVARRFAPCLPRIAFPTWERLARIAEHAPRRGSPANPRAP
jgi:hypothetical protein